eukprot:gb/GEZN01010946.1/.p1 GENE.gb/GEZN01010946.1/~~gb/GEZN01010946.1/.p1  ORF type:complete len:349 (-),score=87.30 gb/GEZN01010946.1/:153-1169(-)
MRSSSSNNFSSNSSSNSSSNGISSSSSSSGSSCSSSLYVLFAVVVHAGLTPNSGHYFSYVRSHATAGRAAGSAMASALLASAQGPSGTAPPLETMQTVDCSANGQWTEKARGQGQVVVDGEGNGEVAYDLSSFISSTSSVSLSGPRAKRLKATEIQQLSSSLSSSSNGNSENFENPAASDTSTNAVTDMCATTTTKPTANGSAAVSANISASTAATATTASTTAAATSSTSSTTTLTSLSSFSSFASTPPMFSFTDSEWWLADDSRVTSTPASSATSSGSGPFALQSSGWGSLRTPYVLVYQRLDAASGSATQQTPLQQQIAPWLLEQVKADNDTLPP